MNFSTLVKSIQSPEMVVEFCQSQNLMAKQKTCTKCNFACTLTLRTYVKDKYAWRCTNKKCRLWTSLRTGTFFARSNLGIAKILKLIYLWSHGVATELTVRHECGISSPNTITDWKNFLRELCREYFKKNRRQIGGPGHTVEIDEILFNRSKYNSRVGSRKRREVQPLWVFGGYDPADEEGFMVTVPDRSAETLLPIIKKYVLPGSTVVSSSWEAFNKLGEGYRHLAVRHRLDFVEPPAPGISGRRNHVEMMWKEATQKNKKECAASKPLLDTYLLEVMWRQQFRADPFLAVVEQIAHLYPSSQQDIKPAV